MTENREFTEILAGLAGPLPPQAVKRRVGWRGADGEDHWIEYIDWHTAADILDRVCPDWSYEILGIKPLGSLVAVTAALTIKGVTRCGVGVGSSFDEAGIKGAEQDALKRAAVKFGLARSLYKGGTLRPVTPAPARPVPDGGQEMVTEKQLAAIYAIARAKSLDARLESQVLFRRAPEELTREAASELIDHLRNIRISA